MRPTLQSALNTDTTRASLPDGTLVRHESEHNATNHLDALAVCSKSDLEKPEIEIKWTRIELDARANKLAKLLREYDELSDIAAPLCTEKCAEM